VSDPLSVRSPQWNDEYTEFRITEADINRGDVSAVNYGANPYTSIEARASEFLDLADRIPAPLARAAVLRLSSRADINLASAGRPAEKADKPEGVVSVDLYSRRFRALVDE
jgi:hypothetical protein